MGISGLDAALSGLRAAQKQLDVISNNVSNVSTEGYTRKVLPQETAVLLGQGSGVRTSPVIRQVDMFVQRDVWTQVSATEFLTVQAGYMNQIQQFHGASDKELSVAAEIARLRDSFVQLANQPDNTLQLAETVNGAQAVVKKMNDLSGLLTQMRNDAQDQARISVDKVNNLLTQISDLNKQIKANIALGRTSAALEDNRDAAIKQLSAEIEISSFTRGDGVLVVQTKQGQQLADETATSLFFKPTPVNADSYHPQSAAGLYIGGNPDVVATAYDLTGTKVGGKIGAYLEMRDTVLPQYQAQLDEVAHKLAQRMEAQGVRLFTNTAGTVPGNRSPLMAEAVGSAMGLSPTTLLNTLPGIVNGNTITLTVDSGAPPLTMTVNATSTINDLLGALNGVSGVSASISNVGQLVVTRTNNAPNTALLSFGGTANLQTSLGINGTQPYQAGPVESVGFASEIRVNQNIVNDPTLLRSSTLPGVTVQDGSSEFIRRVVEFGFGEFEYLQAQGTVNLNVSGIPDTLQGVLGLNPQAQLLGKVDIRSLSNGVDLSTAPDNPYLPVGGPPLLDDFNISINGTPFTVDLSAVATAYPSPPAASGADALVSYLNNDVFATAMGLTPAEATASLNQFGQLIIDSQYDIGISLSGVGSMRPEGLAYLGLSEGTIAAQDPYFDVQVGKDDPVRVTISPGDTELDLLNKLNSVPGVLATLDSSGRLNVRPGPGFGGDIRLIDGPVFSTSGNSVVREIFGVSNPISGVAHTALRQTHLGAGGAIKSGIAGSTTILDSVQKMVSAQTEDIIAVDARLSDEQSYRELIERQFKDKSGVNLDEELAQLIVIQTAYSASAKTITTLEEMFRRLLDAF